MKLNVEVEMGWIDGDADHAFQEQLERAVVEKVTEQLAVEVTKKVADRADKMVTAKTELLINTILEQPITVTKGWQDTTEYDSTFDMVEIRMSQLYGERMDVSSGKCSKDPYLQKVEQYVDSHIKEMLTKVENKLKEHSKKAAQEAINNHELMKAIGATVKTVNTGRRSEDKAFIDA